MDDSHYTTDYGLSVGIGRTSLGDLFFLMDRDSRTSTRPLVIVLHGALRNSENTQPWFPVLNESFDVIFVDLPGHGRSPSDGEPSIPAFTDRFREFLLRHFARRDVVIVGESVGGLIGLGVGDGRTPCVRGVIAADPPLTTAKQWPIYTNFTQRAAKRPISDFLMTFFANAFGYTPKGIIGDRISYSLLAHVKVPALIMTGTLPLFPVRAQQTIPCLLDDVDKAIIRAMKNPHLSMGTVPGAGHLCLDVAFPEARSAVLDFCAARLLQPPALQAG
jgi:pimeloyl-ACP methyl ester carboxylesterase